jgi:hypothetical protein
MARSLVGLPLRVVKGAISIATLPLTLLKRSESPTPREPSPAPGWTTAPDTTGPAMTKPILPSELPIAAYDAMAEADAARAIRSLEDPDEVAMMLAYEQANAKRAAVIQAAISAV